MNRYWFVIVCFVLGGCANRMALLPQASLEAESLYYKVEVVKAFGLPRESLVAATADANGRWRWWWGNVLGMPLARQRLSHGQWRNDGFLPRYPQARRLFAALLYLESAPRRRTELYPQAFEVHAPGETSVYLRRKDSGIANRGEKNFSLQHTDTGSSAMLLTLYPSREQFRIEKLSDD